jgi:hypothetical protein
MNLPITFTDHHLSTQWNWRRDIHLHFSVRTAPSPWCLWPLLWFADHHFSMSHFWLRETNWWAETRKKAVVVLFTNSGPGNRPLWYFRWSVPDQACGVPAHVELQAYELPVHWIWKTVNEYSDRNVFIVVMKMGNSVWVFWFQRISQLFLFYVQGGTS